MKHVGTQTEDEDIRKIVEISQVAYDALSPPEPNTVYLITS